MKEKLLKLREMRREYVRMFGKGDYSTMDLDEDEEMRNLEICLEKKIKWKEVVGYDEAEMYRDCLYD